MKEFKAAVMSAAELDLTVGMLKFTQAALTKHGRRNILLARALTDYNPLIFGDGKQVGSISHKYWCKICGWMAEHEDEFYLIAWTPDAGTKKWHWACARCFGKWGAIDGEMCVVVKLHEGLLVMAADTPDGHAANRLEMLKVLGMHRRHGVFNDLPMESIDDFTDRFLKFVRLDSLAVVSMLGSLGGAKTNFLAGDPTAKGAPWEGGHVMAERKGLTLPLTTRGRQLSGYDLTKHKELSIYRFTPLPPTSRTGYHDTMNL